MTFVAFDLDGTLFDSSRMTTHAAHDVLEEFGADGTDAEIRAFIGRPIDEFHAWLATRVGEGNGARARERFREREYALMPEEGRLFDGVMAMLDELAGVVAALGLYTNARSNYCGTVLDQTGLADRFAAIRPRRETDGDKHEILRDLVRDVGGGDGVVVGDRIDDVKAAHANGLPAIGAGYGFWSGDELDLADAVAESPRDIPDLVRTLLP